MIINFEFKNHRSYRKDVFFTMQRASNLKVLKDSIITKYRDELSRVVAIYGANASGKSGFLEALHTVSSMVDATDKYRGIQQFKLNDQDYRAESEYRITFIAEAKKYVYSYSCGKSGIEFEELQVYDSQKPALLFRRKHNSKKGDSFEFGSKFTSDNIKRIAMVEAKPRETTLLLAMLREWHEEVTRPVYDYLTTKIKVLKANSYIDEYNRVERRIKNDKQFARFINKTLAAVDLGINSVDIMTPSGDVIDKLMKMINADKKMVDRKQIVDSFTRVTFEHYGQSGVLVPFESTEESSGTIAALVFLNLFYDALRDGSVCLIDEIESSLHPILVAKLVEIFNSKRTNPNGAQLIFTTHDISLIENYSDGEVLDRDQIWFAEKNRQGESELYPLTSVQELPREGANIGMKYIHGRYGATPDVSLFDAILNFRRDRKK